MPKFLSSLPLIAVLAMGTALSAQETTTESEAPAAEAATTEAAPAVEGTGATNVVEGLDTGRDVSDGQTPQEDPSYIKATYDDWKMKCFRTGTEEDLCQMYQLLTEEAGNPVAEFSLYRLPKGAPVVAGATIAVPLGTLLTEEIKLSIDGGKAKSYSYSFCTMGGCFARVGLSNSDIEALKRGVKATLEIVPAQAPDQKVNISVSLKGFTAAFENASVLQQ